MAKEVVSVDSDDEDVEYKGDLGIPDEDDCATGAFCSTCAIPPRVTGGLWSAGVGCVMRATFPRGGGADVVSGGLLSQSKLGSPRW